MSTNNSVTITHEGRTITIRREPRRGTPERSQRELSEACWSYRVGEGPCRDGYPTYTLARRAAIAEAEGGTNGK
jgi:hypothetical protein